MARYGMFSGFNSQASYEARPVPKMGTINHKKFQFTGLIRGPTVCEHIVQGRTRVSIHRPHTRPDLGEVKWYIETQLFQFTGLIRGPTSAIFFLTRQLTVSIHRPHTRPDGFGYDVFPVEFMFQFTGLIRGPTLQTM